jgi:glycosyltransferase involved in cell wall biosynthesis
MQDKEQPLVSFCMSTYKRPQMLKKQLELLLQQSYQNFEIIISDNDQEESGRSAVEDVKDQRVKYYVNDSNYGMVKSFNKSIQRSTGNFIVMITDDDPAYPYMLHDLIRLSNQYPEFGVYAGCGDLIIENEFSKSTLGRNIGTNSTILSGMKNGEVMKVSPLDLPELYLDGFFSNTYLLWSCCIVRREVILEIRGMPDYDSELLTDHAFVIAAGSHSGLVYINKSMGGQSIHGENFGFDFSSIIDKYVNTPMYFHQYLSVFLNKRDNWNMIERKLWNFVGRGYVEYSLMIFKSLHRNKQSKDSFFAAFNKVFLNKYIKKWKYKFYLKAYFNPLFNILLFLKKKLKS